MPQINDLNFKNWKEKTIKIFGDKYGIRRTFDAIDYVGEITGHEVCDGNGKFLLQYDCENLSDLIDFLKWRIYKVYENTHSYNQENY